MKRTLIAALLLLGIGAHAKPIKHIFLATDESRKQLIYVNEFDPSKDWSVDIGKNRDIQLAGKDRVIVSVPTGYREYEIKTGKLVKDVTAGKGVASAWREKNGHTFLAGAGAIWELDGNDKVVNTVPIAAKMLRLARRAKDGHFMFTGSPSSMLEVDSKGQTVREIDLTTYGLDAKKIKPYMMAQLADGNYLISTGYGSSLLIVDKNSKLIREIGGKGNVPGVSLVFFGSAEMLPNGNIVVAHWTGHKATDSSKAPQVLEFDKNGKVVWKWQDPQRAGSLHGVVVLK